jgi:C1A family cysteine protease
MPKSVIIQEKFRKGGWIPGLPDIRDYTMESPQVFKAYERFGVFCGDDGDLIIPPDIDLSEFDSPVEDQGTQGTCTANAAAGLVEHMERRTYGTYIDHSRKFIYKMSRQLNGDTGDVGATVSATLASLIIFGSPPEAYWPYTKPVDDQPTAFEHGLAQNYQGTNYVNLSKTGTTPAQILHNMKLNLTSGLPVMFGFTMYSSISSCNDGYIKYPLPGETSTGGHCVLAVGFNDTVQINNGSYTSIGAFYIKNSWATSWGIDGYGWLPYDYITNGLATDCWTLVNMEWIELGQFTLSP